MEIMLDDLNPKKQQELLSYLGLKSPQEGNYDILPLFIISDIQTTEMNDRESCDRLILSFLTVK